MTIDPLTILNPATPLVVKNRHHLVYFDQTTAACPEQWEGRTADGKDVYLRHRHGHGYIEVGATTQRDGVIVAEWEGPLDGHLAPGQVDTVLASAGLIRPAAVA